MSFYCGLLAALVRRDSLENTGISIVDIERDVLPLETRGYVLFFDMTLFKVY